MTSEDSPAPERGMPIYLDPIDRELVDTTDENSTVGEWHPMKGPTTRLFKCYEAMSDIEVVLEDYARSKNIKKRRRKLRSIFTPLHSLAEHLVHLIDIIQSDTSIHDRLPEKTTSTLTLVKSKLVELVPFDRKGKLGILRNKTSAHYDKSLSPAEMKELYGKTDSTEVGEWLHVCISIMCDLMKLDAYGWSAHGPTPDTVIVMSKEPLMAVLATENGEVVELAGAFMRKVSPLTLISQKIQHAAELSQGLFEREARMRLVGFHPDSPIDWARSLTTLKYLST